MPPDPPWRTPLGRTFFHLPSPVGEYTQHESNKAEGESAKGSSYTDILKRTFKDFSDVSVGSDVEIVHLHRQYPPKASAAAEEELEEGELEQDDWTVDIEPMRGYVEDDSNSIIFDDDDDGEPPNEPADLPSFHGECWNCLQQGHSLTHCPYPRNHLQINHSRELFFYARDNLPPPRTERYLHDYLNMRVTVQEKERRLELLGKFRPGKIGKELDHAARMLVDDSDSGEMLVDEIQWDKREYEWIQNIAKWGYPPGWTTALNPIEFLKDRISSLEAYDTAYRLTPEPGEELVIFGADDDEDDEGSSMRDVTLGNADEREKSKEEGDDGSEMSIVSDSPSPSSLPLSPASSRSPPTPSDIPPPPSPPPDLPPPPPPPPCDLPPPPPPNRWADYHTDMFASSRLVVYDETRPFVLGTYAR